jgi:antitoxin MazE
VYIRADILERSGAMKMQIGRWGNSLAVRLPKSIVDRFGLCEGDEIDTSSLEATLEDDRQRNLEERREAAFREIERMRRPLPPDWKFDREEANAR